MCNKALRKSEEQKTTEPAKAKESRHKRKTFAKEKPPMEKPPPKYALLLKKLATVLLPAPVVSVTEWLIDFF